MRRENLDVLDVPSPIGRLIFDLEIGKLDVIVEDGKVMCLRPVRDLVRLSGGSAIRIRAVAIGLLEKLLVGAFQLVVEHDAVDARAVRVQPIGAAEIRPVEVRVMRQLACLHGVGVVGLRRLVLGPAMTLEDLATPRGERHERQAPVLASSTDAMNESFPTEVIEVAAGQIARAVGIVPEIARGDDTEGANRRQRAHFRPAQGVLAFVDDDVFARSPAREVEALGGDRSRLNGPVAEVGWRRLAGITG